MDSMGNDSSGVGSTNVTMASTNSPLAPHANWKWFWLGLMLAVAPLLVPYFISLWANPTYRYFPFAILAVVLFARGRSDGYFYPPRGWISWLSLCIALLLVVAGTVLRFPWFAAVALVIVSTAMLYAMRGEDDPSLIAVVLPLLTVVQLVRADKILVQELQKVTTWMSSVLLDAFAVPHAVANNVIQLADRELFVAEACSGIQSVFTLGFLALMIVVWRRRRVWMAPFYLLIACLLAVFANVIRVTVVAMAAHNFQADLAEGWPHELLGYVALAIAFGFLLSFDHLIATVLHQIPDETEFNPFIAAWNYFSLRPTEQQLGRGTVRTVRDRIRRDEQSGGFAWGQWFVDNRIAQIGFAVVAGLVCIASLSQVVASRKPVDIVFSHKDLVFDPPEELLGESLTNLNVVSHTANRGFQVPRLGANSDVWECEWNTAGNIQVVLSQPHKGWHELCDCYERLDWLLLDRRIVAPEDFESLSVSSTHPDALQTTYVLARFKRGPAEYSYLLYAGIGSDGTLIDAPDALSAFTHRVWNRIDSTGVWAQNEVIMLQMWITTPEKLKSKKLLALHEEFIAARASFAAAIAANAGRDLPTESAVSDKDDSVATVATGNEEVN